MQLKPLADRIIAVKEEPMTQTKSGILLGEAKEKPAYAVVESVEYDVKTVKRATKSSTRTIPRPTSRLTIPNTSSSRKKTSSPLSKLAPETLSKRTIKPFTSSTLS